MISIGFVEIFFSKFSSVNCSCASLFEIGFVYFKPAIITEHEDSKNRFKTKSSFIHTPLHYKKTMHTIHFI